MSFLRALAGVENHARPAYKDTVMTVADERAARGFNEGDGQVVDPDDEDTEPGRKRRRMALEPKEAEPPGELVFFDDPFDGPLERLPRTRAQVYSVYGTPPKGPRSAKHSRAPLEVFRNLPGTWNNAENGACKLYMHSLFGPYVREALRRIELVLGSVPIKQMGAFHHRHMRHDDRNPLSYHSWAIAIDIDHKHNRGVDWFPRYQRKINGVWKSCPAQVAKRGPVPLPFSLGWLSVYPEGMPYEVVRGFLSVGLCWGGTWSYDDRLWIDLVEKHGVGYDPTVLFGEDLAEYQRATELWKKAKPYVDAMHFEGIDRTARTSAQRPAAPASF